MTYLVLARKWRPRSFDTLVGQDHVVRALTHALDTQRLHHAWLFTGTRGVGKTTLSRILAKSLNCETGITSKPCGQCRACTEIDAGRFVDYVELDAASNRGVEEMTQLLEQAVYAPSSARFKVYMIDEVHMLTGHAFNAMLKTLEEPPPHVKFILATTDPQKIPVTVLSRCLQFNLKHMTVDSIVEHLESVLSQEALSFEVPALRLLGQAAGGSMRDALSLTDQAIAYSAGNLSLEAVQGMLGTIDQRHLVRLLQALSTGQAGGVLAVADELASRGLSYAGALADLAVMLSRIAIQQRVPGVSAADDPLAADIEALAAAIHPDLIQLYYSVAVHSRSELALAPDEYAGFVMACLRMLSLTPESAHLPEPPTPEPGKRAAHNEKSVPAEQPAVESQPQDSARAIAQPEQPAQQVPEQATGHHGAAGPSLSPSPLPASAKSPSSLPEEAAPQRAHSVQAQAEKTEVAPVVQAQDAAPDTGPDIPAWEALPDDVQSADSVNAQAGEVETASVEAVSVAEPIVAPSTESAASMEKVPAEAVGETVPAEAVDEPVPAEVADEPQFETAPPPDDGAPDMSSFADAASADDYPDYDNGDWEPVLDGMGDADADIEAADLAAASLGAAALAPLAGSGSESTPRAPRLARMTAQDWPDLAASLPLTGLADELAHQSEWVGVEGDTITLRVAIWSLAAKQGQARLRTVLTEHFGKVVQLKILFGTTGGDTARAVEQVRQAERQRQAEEAVENDPLVLSLIEEFGAQVIPGSIAALDNERAA